MNIKAYNYQTQGAPLTFLSNPLSSGGTVIPVKNINQFTASHAIQIGQSNQEQSEIKLLTSSSPSGTALNITGTITYDHPIEAPVYDIKFDQLIFKRSISGTAGTATALTNGTVSIKPDEEYTAFDDTTGAITYAYKASYRNSISGEESADSDWLTPDGYSYYSRINIRNRIKNKLYNASFIKDDTVLDEWTNEWLETMNNAAVKVNQNYNMGTVDVRFSTEGMGTITSADFKKSARIWVTYDGSRYAESTYIPLNEIKPNSVYSGGEVRHTYRGDTVLQILPAQSGGTARIDYARTFQTLDNDTDELPTVMKSYSKSFVDYGKAQAHYMDDKDAKGDRAMNEAKASKDDFISDITPRDYTGPQTINFTEELTANYAETDF